MPRSWSKGILGALLLAGAVALACSDKGTEPKPAGFNIYIAGTYWTDPYDVQSRVDQVYVVNGDGFGMVDSIRFPSPPLEAVPSPDGRWLYTWRLGWGVGSAAALSKIDLGSNQIVWTVEGTGGGTTLLKDGDLLVVRAFQGTVSHAEVLNTKDGTVVRRLPDSLVLWYGPTSGTKVAAVAAGDSNRIRVVDVESAEMYGSYVPRLRSGGYISSYYAVLHNDKRRVLLIGPRTVLQDSWFVVGDVLTGETLLEHELVYPFGEIAISGNGTTAVVTDPSRPLVWDSDPTLDVFNLRQMSHVWRPDSRQFRGFPGQIRFLPGDQRVVTAMPAMMGTEPLHIIDVTQKEVVGAIYLSGSDTTVEAGTWTGALGVGPHL
ncbi:MAG: hypothetical protein AB1792_07565 [Candidatus Zixiibacteriota bacterium]